MRIESDTFETEFTVVTGRTVKIVSVGESPDRVVLIDGIETGVELTSVRAASADDIVSEVLRLRAGSMRATKDAASSMLGQSFS